MGAMDFDDIEARIAGPARSIAPCSDQRPDFVNRQSVGNMPTGIHGFGHGSDRWPRALVARLCIGAGKSIHAVPRPLAAGFSPGMS